MKRGVGQTRIRRTLWRQGEDEEGRQLVTEVPMKLVKLWDPDVDRYRVQVYRWSLASRGEQDH